MQYFVYKWDGIGHDQQHLAVTGENRGDDFLVSFTVDDVNTSVTSAAVSALIASGINIENTNVFLLVD